MLEKIRRSPVLSAAAVLAIVLAVGLRTFAAPCGAHEDGSIALCAGTSVVEFRLALGALVLLLFGISASERMPHIIFSALTAAVGIAVAALPGTYLQLCLDEAMRCHAIMRPACLVLGAAIAVLALVEVGIRARRA